YLGSLDRVLLDRAMYTDLLGTFLSVFFELGFAKRPVIDNKKIKSDLRGVLSEFLNMLSSVEAIGLTRLGHQVGDEYLNGLRFGNCIGNSVNEYRRQQAGIKRARPDRNDIRRSDGSEGCGHRLAALRFEIDTFYRAANL